MADGKEGDHEYRDQGNNPVAPPAKLATEVVQNVGEAQTGAVKLSEKTGEEGWKVVAEELRGLRADINLLIKTPEAAVKTGEEVTEPVVETVIPTPPERKIRRGARKVKR